MSRVILTRDKLKFVPNRVDDCDTNECQFASGVDGSSGSSSKSSMSGFVLNDL